MRLPSPSSPVRASALFLIFASLGGPAAAQGAFDPQTSALLLADANGDGDVAADEWAALLSELDPDGDGSVSETEVSSFLLTPEVAAEGDGALPLASMLSGFAGFVALESTVQSAQPDLLLHLLLEMVRFERRTLDVRHAAICSELICSFTLATSPGVRSVCLSCSPSSSTMRWCFLMIVRRWASVG